MAMCYRQKFSSNSQLRPSHANLLRPPQIRLFSPCLQIWMIFHIFTHLHHYSIINNSSTQQCKSTYFGMFNRERHFWEFYHILVTFSELLSRKNILIAISYFFFYKCKWIKIVNFQSNSLNQWRYSVKGVSPKSLLWKNQEVKPFMP